MSKERTSLSERTTLSALSSDSLPSANKVVAKTDKTQSLLFCHLEMLS